MERAAPRISVVVALLRARAGSIAHWESERDRGLYHAFNKALGKASGDWIYFLGADDYLWERQALERKHLAEISQCVSVSAIAL